jgi:hypothetical protein
MRKPNLWFIGDKPCQPSAVLWRLSTHDLFLRGVVPNEDDLVQHINNIGCVRGIWLNPLSLPHAKIEHCAHQFPKALAFAPRKFAHCAFLTSQLPVDTSFHVEYTPALPLEPWAFVIHHPDSAATLLFEHSVFIKKNRWWRSQRADTFELCIPSVLRKRVYPMLLVEKLKQIITHHNITTWVTACWQVVTEQPIAALLSQLTRKLTR